MGKRVRGTVKDEKEIRWERKRRIGNIGWNHNYDNDNIFFSITMVINRKDLIK